MIMIFIIYYYYRFPVKPEEEIKIFVRWMVVVPRYYATGVAN